jgi:hypothetical protein
MYERETTASTIKAGGTMNGEFTGKFFVFRIIGCSIRQRCKWTLFVCAYSLGSLTRTFCFLLSFCIGAAGLSGG